MEKLKRMCNNVKNMIQEDVMYQNVITQELVEIILNASLKEDFGIYTKAIQYLRKCIEYHIKVEDWENMTLWDYAIELNGEIEDIIFIDYEKDILDPERKYDGYQDYKLLIAGKKICELMDAFLQI
ncbi:MAG: hypothetical protein KH366_10585 [Clostridiaceae bacterium]|nr:hypothetical protein [Clostridiaceae bacterium]